MNHTIQEIINNQTKFKDKITKYLIKEFNSAKKELKKIKSHKKDIIKEKEKLEKKITKIKPLNSIGKFFFMNSKRNRDFYVWWDEESNEAVILKYEKN